MKLAKTFAICMIAVALSLFALAGCEGAGGGNTGASPEGDASGNNGEDTNGVLESGLIIATAPNDFVGDFSFDGEVVCSGVNSCEFEVAGVVTVQFVSKDKLFLNKYATANPDEVQEVTWDEPGDWGLAPQGIYVREEGQIEGLTKTWFEDGQILLEWKGTVLGTVDEDKFVREYEDGGGYSGSISTDLKSIVYVATSPSGNKDDVTLKRVE